MTMIVAWLWQGLAIAAFTALALYPLKRLSAATRHAIWWLALIAVVVLPLVQLASHSSGELSGELAAGAPAMAEAQPAMVVVPGAPAWVTGAAFTIWVVWLMAGLARVAGGLRRIRKIKNESHPFDSDRQRRLALWASVRASGRRADLRLADIPSSASALGFFRPAIVVSRRLADALDDDRLDQIVMHEHAHLARRDDWMRLAQALVAAAAGLHPAVRFISRRIDLEREAACDDYVVARTGAPATYARCLAEAAAVSTRSLEAVIIPGAIGSARTLVARVGRVLDPARGHAPRLARCVSLAGALLFVGIVIGSTSVAPLVMFVESRAGVAVRAFAAPAVTTGPAAVEIERELSPRRAPVARNAKPKTPTVNRTRVDTAPAAVGAAGIERRRSDGVDATARVDAARVDAARLDAVPLEAARLDVPHEPPAPARAVARQARDTSTPWGAAATAGVAIGDGAKRSGLAVGGFFTRTGKAIAHSF